MTFFDDDDDEAEFEESLKGLDISFAVPEPTDDAEVAAKWVNAPDEMLETLTIQLNAILSKCEARLFDGVSIQLKPEYLVESSAEKQTLVFMSLSLGFTADNVDLTNAIQQTPFRGETARHLSKMLYQGNSLQFDAAIADYKSSLRVLANWIYAKAILSGKASARTTKTKSADIDDVKKAWNELHEQGVNPTKENIANLIRSWDLTIGTSRAHKLKREIEKQSAVRPPNSAD